MASFLLNSTCRKLTYRSNSIRTLPNTWPSTPIKGYTSLADSPLAWRGVSPSNIPETHGHYPTLRGVPHVICYLNDLLMTGVNEEDHLHLEQAFYGTRVEKEKCIFLAKSVEYLGHQISKHGIQALPCKVEAIAQAPEPKNVQQLGSFLGLLN